MQLAVTLLSEQRPYSFAAMHFCMSAEQIVWL